MSDDSNTQTAAAPTAAKVPSIEDDVTQRQVFSNAQDAATRFQNVMNYAGADKVHPIVIGIDAEGQLDLAKACPDGFEVFVSKVQARSPVKGEPQRTVALLMNPVPHAGDAARPRLAAPRETTPSRSCARTPARN